MRLRNVAASFALVCSSAFAGPPYDGIYQIGASNEWLAVMEKNGFLILSYYQSNPSNNIVTWPLPNGQRFTPGRLDNWDLLSGPVANGFATVTGETIYGACKLTIQINFHLPALRLTFIEPTAAGFAQGVNCLDVANSMIFLHGNVNEWPLTKIW